MTWQIERCLGIPHVVKRDRQSVGDSFATKMHFFNALFSDCVQSGMLVYFSLCFAMLCLGGWLFYHLHVYTAGQILVSVLVCEVFMSDDVEMFVEGEERSCRFDRSFEFVHKATVRNLI